MKHFLAGVVLAFASLIANAAAASPAAPGAPASPQSYEALTAANAKHGLFTLVQKDGDVLLGLDAAQLDTPYLLSMTVAGGMGGFMLNAGEYLNSGNLVEFKRAGEKILIVLPNQRFIPADGAPAELVNASSAESTIASAPIVAEDTAHSHILISASALVNADIPDISQALTDVGKQQGVQPGLNAYRLDAARTYLESAKAFPQNVTFVGNLTYAGTGDVYLPSIPDSRAVGLKIHYSLVQLPRDDGYVPRLADDRVGYFTEDLKAYGNEDRPTPYVHYIQRWNLDRGPIVYYLAKEIPQRYRATIKRALLSWNSAFARVGYPHAVEVRDQPDDPEWDPEDVRYNTIRWVESDTPSYLAEGPSLANPLTGEIFRSSVLIDAEAVRSLHSLYTNYVSRGIALSQPDSGECPARFRCFHTHPEAVEAVEFAQTALQSFGSRSQPYVDELMSWLVLHESGHDFGLRHNFEGTHYYALSKIENPTFAAAHPISMSVMDYIPPNLVPRHKHQPPLYRAQLGPYDYWAIEYGYRKFAGVRRPWDEKAQLDRIASLSTKPEYAYGTDEDVFGAAYEDPAIATWDLGRDPLAFAAQRFGIIQDVINRLPTTYPRTGESYAQERGAFLTAYNQYFKTVDLVIHYVGAVHTSRSHRGQSGGASPLRPYSRSEQKRAFGVLSSAVFGAAALRVPPALLQQLGPNNEFDWNRISFGGRKEVQYTDLVSGLQDGVLAYLFNPIIVARLIDNVYATSPESTMSLADLFDWLDASIYSRAALTSADPIERGLQQRYIERLCAMLTDPDKEYSAVAAAQTRALARQHIDDLQRRFASRLSGTKDRALQDHLRTMLDAIRRSEHAITVER